MKGGKVVITRPLLPLPTDLLLALAEEARARLRLAGLDGDGETAARALAAAAGASAGLAALDVKAANRLNRDCADAFRRAYEMTGAAGHHLEGRTR